MGNQKMVLETMCKEGKKTSFTQICIIKHCHLDLDADIIQHAATNGIINDTPLTQIFVERTTEK